MLELIVYKERSVILMVRKSLTILTTLIVLCAINSIFAQQAAPQGGQAAPQGQTATTATTTEPAPAEAYSEADRPEDNYLEKFHALEVCDRLVAENLDRIYTLNIIKTNFKSLHSDWETDYQNVYKGYKEAVDLYYRRDIIYAKVRLEENKAAINKFYQKIGVAFKADCLQLLSKCADTILEMTLGVSGIGAGGTGVRKASAEIKKALFENNMRIRIAYAQMADAEDAIMNGNYYTAVFHFRLAKGYAINILETLDPAKNQGQYDIHKADNKNRILTERKTVVREEQVK